MGETKLGDGIEQGTGEWLHLQVDRGEKSIVHEDELKGNRFLNPAATASPSARGWRGFNFRLPTSDFPPHEGNFATVSDLEANYQAG